MNKAEESLKAVLQEVRQNLRSVFLMLEEATPESMREHVSSLDRNLRSAFDALDDCAGFCELHRPSTPREYDPIELVSGEVGHFRPEKNPLAPAEPEAYWGDPAQLGLCIRVAVRALAKRGIAFTIRVYLDTNEPRIEITPDHAVPLPLGLSLGERFTLTAEEFGHFWTAATDGGELRLRDDSYVLFLTGDRTRLSLQAIAAPVRTAVTQAARTLSPWKGAVGQYEEGLVSPKDALGLYRRGVGQALELVDDALASIGQRAS